MLTSSALPSDQLTASAPTAVDDLLAAIKSDDAEGMANALQRIENEQGQAGAAAIAGAIVPAGLTRKLLDALAKRAESLNTAVAWRQAAEVAFVLQDQDLAQRAATEAIKHDPAITSAAFVLAAIANRQAKFDEALKIINSLLAVVPQAKNDPFMIVQMAIAQLGTNQPETALSILEPSNAVLTAAGLGFDRELLRARAFALMTGKQEAAVKAWEAALAVATPDQANLVRYEYAGLLWSMKRHDEALRQLELGIQGTSDKPTLASLHEARSNVYIDRGDFQGAIGAINDQLANVFNPDARLGLRLAQARIAVARKEWKEAAGYFDAALTEAQNKKRKRFEIRLEKAQALALADYDLVKADLDELDRSETASNWSRAIDVRITGLLTNNRPEEALKWLNDRLAKSPDLVNHPAAHQVRADIEMKLGNVEAALDQYAQAAKVPSGATDPRAWAAALMGAFTTQQWTLTISLYEQYVKLNPSAVDPSARVMAAVAYARSNQPQVALQLTEGDEPLPPIFSLLRDQTRAEAQLRLAKYDDVLKTTAEATQRPDISPDFVLGAQLMRIQALNQLKRFADAEKTATAALESFTDLTNAIQGLMPFLRLGVLVQRSLAFYSLSKYREAHNDLDDAISGFEKLRSSVAVKMLEKAVEFASFESSIWYAKGAVFDAERRNDESLNAYNRSFRLEVNGCSAAIARGYALSRVGEFANAVQSFDVGLSRAVSANDRATALAGKGLAFVRLRRYEQAITTLQAALDVRLAESESDDPVRRDETSVVFEYLGIAYAEIDRNSAALNAFMRAWKLTPKNKRDKDKANVARGIAAARLKLNNPARLLEEWKELHKELQNDPTLLFNRALALDATGKRSEAMKHLVLAKKLGLRQAQELLERLDRPTGLNRWTREWFGVQVSTARRACGALLLLVAGFGLGAPFYQWLLSPKMDWYWLLVPSVAALIVFALPSLRSIKAAGVELSAEPLAATGRDASTPETFNLPTFAAPIAAESKFV